MRIGEWIRRVLRPLYTASVSSPNPETSQNQVTPAKKAGEISSSSGANDGKASAIGMEKLEAWLAACEAGCLDPPQDMHDRGAWDEYWKSHLEVGALDQGFSDQLSSDPELPGLLTERGSSTILCVGNGLSTEAISLSLLGFNVTALDISAIPEQVFSAMLKDDGHPIRQIPDFRMHDDGSFKFGGAGPIDPGLCPPMHRCEVYAPKGGGSLKFVTGDLIVATTCPGPFDVVIERRTLQLFPETERPVALDRLVSRLSNPGVFVSHQHESRWKPGDRRMHYAEAWLLSQGFVIHSKEPAQENGFAARLAYLVFSSG